MITVLRTYEIFNDHFFTLLFTFLFQNAQQLIDLTAQLAEREKEVQAKDARYVRVKIYLC